MKLPEFQPVAPSHFHWCPVGSSTFCQSLDSAYQEVVHWKKNNFEVPRGSVGKQFVSELALLFRAVGEGSALESIPLKAVFLHVVYCCRSLLVPPHLRNTPPCWNDICNSGMMARLGTWSARVVLFRVTCPLVPRTFLILNWSGPLPI